MISGDSTKGSMGAMKRIIRCPYEGQAYYLLKESGLSEACTLRSTSSSSMVLAYLDRREVRCCGSAAAMCDTSAMLPYAESAWQRARSDINPMLGELPVELYLDICDDAGSMLWNGQQMLQFLTSTTG